MTPKKTRAGSQADDTPLQEVRPGCLLHWPQRIGGGVRGDGGTVVRSDDPLLHLDVRQDAVLRPAPEGAQVSRHENPRAMALYLQLGFESPPPFRGPGGAPQAQAQAPSPEPPVAKPSPEPATDAKG